MPRNKSLTDKLDVFSKNHQKDKPVKIVAEQKDNLEINNAVETAKQIDNEITTKLTNKFKSGELVQISLLVTKSLRKELKKFAFENEKKVNSVIVEAVEKHIKNIGI